MSRRTFMRGTTAVSMASLVGDFDTTDIEGKAIVAVGRTIVVGEDMEGIDGTDLLAIPGIQD